MRKNEKKLRKAILKEYLSGTPQEKILETISTEFKNFPKKKIKTLVYESEFLSPKNFRLGAFLLLIIGIAMPTLTIYMRGFEYRLILDDIILMATLFSIPFGLIGVFLYKTKDLNRINNLAVILIGYLVVHIGVMGAIAADIKVWTLPIFPIILLPTFVAEYLKLRHLTRTITEISS